MHLGGAKATIVGFPIITIEKTTNYCRSRGVSTASANDAPNRRNQLMPVRRAAIPTTGPRGAIPGAIT